MHIGNKFHVLCSPPSIIIMCYLILSSCQIESTVNAWLYTFHILDIYILFQHIKLFMVIFAAKLYFSHRGQTNKIVFLLTRLPLF